jgi:hypothetical protein
MTSHEDGFSTRLLRVNTRYRSAESVSNTDFFYDLPSSEVSESVFRVALTRFSCLYLFPNVDHFNNDFVFVVNGFNADWDIPITITITVPIGQYTIEQLLEQLNASPVLSQYLVLTFDSVTKLVSLSPYPAYSITVLVNDSNNVARLLGLFPRTTVFYFPHTVATAFPCVPDLGGPQQLYIESPNLAGANCIDNKEAGGGGYLSLLDLIPLHNIPHGYVIAWEANDLASSDVDFRRAESLRRIHFRITDGHNHVMTLPLNQEIDMIVKLFYSR